MNQIDEFKMRLIKLKAVMDCTGLGRSTVYNYIAENQFPKPVSLGLRAVAWVASEVQNWILEKIEARDLFNETGNR
ncbi:MAG: prophage regulatory protein [Cocleimonas sp.]